MDVEDFDVISENIAAYRGMNDRASVIVGVSTLEVVLEKLISALVLQDNSATLFESGGPCSTLSNKVSIAFSLGLIHRDERSDLNVLRWIRNKFAHDADHRMTLQDQQHSSRIDNLKLRDSFSRDELDEHVGLEPREVLHFTISYYITDFTQSRIPSVRERKLVEAPPIPQMIWRHG